MNFKEFKHLLPGLGLALLFVAAFTLGFVL